MSRSCGSGRSEPASQRRTVGREPMTDAQLPSPRAADYEHDSSGQSTRITSCRTKNAPGGPSISCVRTCSRCPSSPRADANNAAAGNRPRHKGVWQWVDFQWNGGGPGVLRDRAMREADVAIASRLVAQSVDAIATLWALTFSVVTSAPHHAATTEVCVHGRAGSRRFGRVKEPAAAPTAQEMLVMSGRARGPPREAMGTVILFCSGSADSFPGPWSDTVIVGEWVRSKAPRARKTRARAQRWTGLAF